MSKLWTDEAKVNQLTELYNAALEADKENGTQLASKTDSLTAIGKAVGATVPQIRGKLIALGIYVKADVAPSVAKTNTVRKEHWVRAIANCLRLEADELESLKNANAAPLEAIANSLGVTSQTVLDAAAKDYSPRPEMIVMSVAESLELDFDDLDTYNEELLEAANAE